MHTTGGQTGLDYYGIRLHQYSQCRRMMVSAKTQALISSSLQSTLYLDTFKYFYLIAHFDVVVIFHCNTAFTTTLNFFDVILEAA